MIVAGCVVRQNDKYLLVQERLPRAYGLWNIPAGHVDSGETDEEAAIREFKEEVGLDVRIDRSIATYAEEGESIKHAFVASITGGELKPDLEEILSAAWLTYDEISELNDKQEIRAPWIWDAISRVEHEFADFSYQIVGFLDREPEAGELIYTGEHGWYPQIALKRRFRLNDISQSELISKLTNIASEIMPIHLTTGGVSHPDRMPVDVISIKVSSEVSRLHTTLISRLGSNIISKYPNRGGKKYFPHITLDYNGKKQFDPAPYLNRPIVLSAFWLVKDHPGTLEAEAINRFTLS